VRHSEHRISLVTDCVKYFAMLLTLQCRTGLLKNYAALGLSLRRASALHARLSPALAEVGLKSDAD
jgi:hypothetical protein